jgi:5-methylcytosine-specific restriction endonuclease McrA
MIKREVRERVFAKYDEHCAYCGKIIAYNEMQVDHLIPIRQAEEGKVDWREVENENNYMPACRRCNHYKRGNSLETFRTMIYEIPNKLHHRNYIFKVGEDFGNIKPIYCMPIVFYFERMKGGVQE